MTKSSLAFDALADSTRRTILRVLADRGECRVGEIASEVTQVGRTAVSSHLRILRSAGLVNERRDGRYRMYSVDRDSLDGVVEFLSALYRAPLDELRARMEAPALSDEEARNRGRPGPQQ
ncbi:MAG: ArsR family transcriptional regulator, arsenate/arsenite/antimonite-responsive transcriptional [Solirubrobacteraceae bacterium]|nr:ArsR family transcriptional regulator, arsenate/arsenite/antimonite-responsive transcriptional [Solirubrobacteraceae bacterium]MEA2289977.1 ArsR family transcriptional regulator, arsenate/arsenite/antimonite-responsive transcriptional [Solirubrobacteraceae bacterium]